MTVICDEIHCEITAPGIRYTPFASLSPEFAQNSISFVSPTKGFTIPGLQIANIVSANPDFRSRMDRVINIWEHCDVNQLGIVALQAAYTPEGADWLKQMNEVVHANFVELRDTFASRYPSVRMPAELEATYLVWADLQECRFSVQPQGASGDFVAGQLLGKHKVRINGGSIYGGPTGIRINVACPRTTFKEGLRRICEGLDELLEGNL